MKKVTSFTHHVTAEGDRISYTYSEIDEDGHLIKQNVRENFVVVNTEVQQHIHAINEFILKRLG